MVELLSPARDFTALEAALQNGADAVYVGVEGHNMRAHTANFSIKNLSDAANRCHDHGARLYVCTNTVMSNQDIEDLKIILPEIKSAGTDAVIASDLGAIKIANQMGIDVHFSVQGNISNSESIKLLADLGVTRVILSRELSLNEIKEIIKDSPLEVEVFVHGAMCLAISGRCFLSAYLYQKNANCGECLQPCRKNWKLICEEDDSDLSETHEKTNQLSLRGLTPFKENYSGSNSVNESENDFNVFNENNGFEGHIMSPNDLCMVEHVPEMIKAGISSFKIEGRARPADYVATVTRVYREAIDAYNNGSWDFKEEWMEDLKKIYHRGYDTGFYFQKPYKTSVYNQATHKKQDAGEVVNYYSQVKAAEIRLWNLLKVGDEIIIQGPTTGSYIQTVKSMQIEGKTVEIGEKNQSVGILLEKKVRPGDLVYKRLPK